MMTSNYATLVITSTSYTYTNAEISSLLGDSVWTTACNSASCITFDLSNNDFTSTELSVLNFRRASDSYGNTYETYVKHLDLSHNKITDISLETFTSYSQTVWTLESLDLSYNMLTNISSFPRHLNAGSLKILRLQHNQIFAYGEENVFLKFDFEVFEELNLENNALTKLPDLRVENEFSSASGRIKAKNNKISQLKSSATGIRFAVWWVASPLDFENNLMTTYDFIDNWDAEEVNFNNNKLTSLAFSAGGGGGTPTISDYFLKKLYLNNNELTSIGASILQYMFNLEILEVANNKIASFAFETVLHTTPVTGLKTLILQNNELTSVSDESGNFPRNVATTMNIQGKNHLMLRPPTAFPTDILTCL